MTNKPKRIENPQPTLSNQPGGSATSPVKVAVTAQSSLTYQSPIPPPEILARYNTLVAPDAANRLLQMVEKQEDHRMHLERTAIEGELKRANWGMAAAFVIAIAGIVSSVYLIANGH